jgi:subtilisin family serine protease
MRYLLTITAAVCLIVAGGASAQRSSGPAAGSPTTNWIVVLKDDTANVDAKIASLSSAHGFQTTYRYHHALKGFAAALTQAQADALRADPSVQYLSLDRFQQVLVGTKPIKAGEEVPAGIRRIESAVGNQVQAKSAVAVAVSDTGIDLDHPDLNARDGINCVNPGNPAEDDFGHGVHVAGTIGAKNNGLGLVGISPNTVVIAVKWITSSGGGSESGAICGFDWIIDNKDRFNIGVVQNSWRFIGGPPDDGNCGNQSGDALHKAVCRVVDAGVVVVASAGNENNNYAVNRPAAYNEALTVTAMGDYDGKPGGQGGTCGSTPDDRYASFSSFAAAGGPDVKHTVSGPGVCVRSTWLNGSWSSLSGTSMSGPHVAGTVANCIGHKDAPGPCAGLTPKQVIKKIRQDAAAKPNNYGYTGDPNHTPPAGRYYGFLVSNLGY